MAPELSAAIAIVGGGLSALAVGPAWKVRSLLAFLVPRGRLGPSRWRSPPVLMESVKPSLAEDSKNSDGFLRKPMTSEDDEGIEARVVVRCGHDHASDGW
jgi:hypothetical protein